MTMELSDQSAELADLPAPSAELVLIRVLAETWLQEMPRRQRARVYSELSERVAQLDDMRRVVVIRPPKERGAMIKARVQAKAWFLSAFGPRE